MPVYNQTSVLGYIKNRPYLVNIGLCLAWFAFTACSQAYHNGNTMHRLQIEHSLVGSLLLLAATFIGFSLDFGSDRSEADRWYMTSIGMVTGCTIGGFLLHVVLLTLLKMEPGSSTVMITYAFSLLTGLLLTVASRFKPAISSRLLLLFSSIILAQSISCHVRGTHSLLTALLVGLFHQLFATIYDAGYRGYVELVERALMAGALIGANVAVTFWIRPDDIWVQNGPFVVRVLAFGYGERPDLWGCIALLCASVTSALFLGAMMAVNKRQFARKYCSPSTLPRQNPIAGRSGATPRYLQK